MSFWSLNTCSKHSCNKNEEFMMNNNVGCLSLAHNINDYNNLLIKNGTNTLKQFNYFLQNAKKGDTIYLYKNRVGFIAYGIYNGKVRHLNCIDNLYSSPDFKDSMFQGNIFVDKWILLDKPIKNDYPRRRTLYKLDDDNRWNNEMIFHKLSNYYI